MISYIHMARRFAASTRFWRTALTCGLCMLAFAFAVEAKTAWYGPALGPGSAVRASKAMPADLPRVIDHGIPVPDPIHPQVPFAMLAVLAILLATVNIPLRHDAAHHRSWISLAAFSPQVFFRPPPVLS
jgi:hypothetical protein